MRTAIDISTTRSYHAVGRDLIRAAVAATAEKETTPVAFDGRQVAVVLPSGPAESIPVRAERQALMGHVTGRYRAAFKPDAEVGAPRLLARAVADFLDWDGADILALAGYALEEANEHELAARVRALRGEQAS